MNVALLGSGNVASWLVYALKKANIAVCQVYSRNLSHASSLASLCHAQPICDLKQLRTDCDCYIFSLKDDAYEEVLGHFPFQMSCAIHTAGSVSLEVLSGHATHYGVMYPFQTISKSVEMESLTVPLCVEGNDEVALKRISSLARLLSPMVYPLDEQQRALLHLAAVFASNFSNALYGVASDLLNKAGLDWSMMMPLLQQTLKKTETISPVAAQTGPAVRGDESVMQKHLNQLDSEELRKIYGMLSQLIMSRRR